MATADVLAEPGVRVGSTSPISRWHTRAVEAVPAGSYVAFRVAFGLVVVWSTVRFVARGWVLEFYLAPTDHLTYAGFEWVRPLPGPFMYAHMLLLAALGVAIVLGRRPRLAAGAFAVGFAYVELIDAALYLNHYWFVTLAAITLAILPNPTAAPTRGPTGQRTGGTVPAVTVWVLRGQVAVVYLFAGIAKLNPDWLFDAQPMQLWLAARTDRPIVGPLLGEPVVGYLFSWLGALFDLTIVGWLLWRRSRPFAYVAVIAFHVATAMLFQIGIFPWVMIALTPVFFSPDWPKRLMERGTGRRSDASSATSNEVSPVTSVRVGRTTTVALLVLVAVNVFLPLRHYAADGNVRFNDDGYYLSWRVMLTERTGYVDFRVVDPRTGTVKNLRMSDVLTEWQAAQANQRPDLVLATAHLIADRLSTEASSGPDVQVYADAWVAFNGRPRQRWIDPAVDLAATARDAPAHDYVLAVDSDVEPDPARGPEAAP